MLCKVTITTSDDALAAKIEPGVGPSSERFRMIRRLSDAGIYAGILLMPVLPYLEDSPENIRQIVQMAADAGARFIYPAFGVTLRGNQRDWYYGKLNELFPGQGYVEKYQKRYGSYYECRSPKAKSLWNVLKEECEKHHILYQMKDIIHSYRQPYAYEQLSLF